jgi:FKBP-type peptidyl-prolyl cis-trans isomerase
MKKIIFIAALALMCSATFMSCKGNSKSAMKTGEDSLSNYFGEMYGYGVAGELKHGPDSAKFNKDSFLKGMELILNADTADHSYMQGLNMGLQFLQVFQQIKQTQGVTMNTKLAVEAFTRAFKSDSLKDPSSYQAQVMGLMQRLSSEAKAKDPKAIQNKKLGEQYMQQQMQKDKGFKKTPSGVAYKILAPGNGKKFSAGDQILVKYVGTHINGKVFDQTKDAPVPMSPMGTIPGFKEILLMMSPGAKCEVIIPGQLAYGPEGRPGAIEPNETLVFTLETVGVQPQQKAQGGPQGAPQGQPQAAPARR